MWSIDDSCVICSTPRTSRYLCDDCQYILGFVSNRNGSFLGPVSRNDFVRWANDEIAANGPHFAIARRFLTALANVNREQPCDQSYKRFSLHLWQ